MNETRTRRTETVRERDGKRVDIYCHEWVPGPLSEEMWGK